MDQRAGPDRAAGAQRGRSGLERAVLLRVAHDLAALAENTLVPDFGQSRLGNMDAVVEYPLADPGAHQPPDHILEGRAVENVQKVDRMHLPDTLDLPESGIVDRADRRRRRA